MGLFSSKSTTHVSSVVYNMAGDVKDRADYLKTTVVNRALAGTKKTLINETLDSYLGGPGINLRRFGRWAREFGYNENLGVVQSSVTLPKSLDNAALATALGAVYGKEVLVNESNIGTFDYGMWANQYMLANRPDKYLDNWQTTFDDTTNRITITIPGENPVTFLPAGVDKTANFLYVNLNQVGPGSKVVEAGEWTTTAPGLQDTVPSFGSQDVTAPMLTTATVTQTDTGKDPVVSVIETPADFNTTLKSATYTRTERLPDAQLVLAVGEVTTLIEMRERLVPTSKTTTSSVTENIAPGVDRVTTVVTVAQSYNKVTEYRTTKTTEKTKTWGKEEIFIYRRGSGNATLDTFFSTTRTAGTFFPIIPVRVDNRFISESYYPHLLPWVKKATRRATNHSFEKLVSLVADNPSLGDIDYAYVIFGASLNTPEDTAKRYLYEFFTQVSSIGGSVSMNQFVAQHREAMASWDAWVIWYNLHRNAVDENGQPIKTAPEPVRKPFPNLPVNYFEVSSPVNYRIGISYSGMDQSTLSGQFKVGAKIGDARIYRGGVTQLYGYRQHTDDEGSGRTTWTKVVTSKHESVVIEWQHAPNSFRRLVISDLMHRNYVYGGKVVWISGWEALNDLDESGFIVPLQDEILRRMPLPAATQLCTASTYLMFNCYQVTKQKWYQTGIFKIVVIIVAIVISVYSGGAGAGAAGGLLGTNAAVGAAIGFTGAAAIVAGAVANALVAMVLTQAISSASRAILGEKIGAIVGAIASFAAVSVGSTLAGGQPLSMSFGNMLKAENLFQLTTAVGNGITNYIQASTAEIQQEAAGVLEEYKEQSKSIAERFMQEFGSTGQIDPLAVGGIVPFKLEDPDVFLDRTLMTGTDIADMSLDMLADFPELTVSLPLE